MHRPEKGVVALETFFQKEVNQLDCGSETVVHRADIIYPEFDRVAGGLVMKRLRHPSKDRVALEEDFEDILLQWKYIRSAMARRKKEGKDTLSIPTTIRGYKSETEIGVIMNDLTKGGRNKIIDLKKLTRSSVLVPYEEWGQIKEQILRDLRIAREEGIILTKDTYLPLDAWNVVWEEGRPCVYVVDIGQHTAFEGSAQLLKEKWRRKTDHEILLAGESAVIASVDAVETRYKEVDF